MEEMRRGGKMSNNRGQNCKKNPAGTVEGSAAQRGRSIKSERERGLERG